jgi:hypothetical protein
MEKKRIIKSFEKLTPDQQEMFKEQYTRGFGNSLIRLNNAQGVPFFTVPLETEDAMLLVKVELPKPKKVADDEDSDTDSDTDEGYDDDSSDEDYDSGGDADDPSYEPDFDK